MNDTATGSGEALDPQQEHAKLDEARRRMVDLEYQCKSAQLLQADQVEEVWCRLVRDWRDRMLALPNRAAPLLLGKQSLPEIQSSLEALIYEALESLSQLDTAQYMP